MANKEEQQVVGQAPQAPASPTPTAPVGYDPFGQAIGGGPPAAPAPSGYDPFGQPLGQTAQAVTQPIGGQVAQGGQGAQSSYVPGMVNGPQTEMASAMRIGNEAMSNAGADLATNRASMINPASVPIFPKDTSAVTAPSVYPTSEAIGRGFAAGVEHAGAGIANAAEGVGRFGLGIANTFIQNARNMIGVAKHLAAPAVHGFTAGMGGDETSYNQAQQASIGSPQQDRPTATVATMTPQQKLDVLKRRHAASQTPGDPGISPVGVNVPDIPAAPPEKAAEIGATYAQQQPANVAPTVGAGNQQIGTTPQAAVNDAPPIDIIRGTIGQRVYGASPEFGGRADAVSVDPVLQAYIERAEGKLARQQPTIGTVENQTDSEGNAVRQTQSSSGFQGDPVSVAEMQSLRDRQANEAVKVQAAIEALGAKGDADASSLEFMSKLFESSLDVTPDQAAGAAAIADELEAKHNIPRNQARPAAAQYASLLPNPKDYADGGPQYKANGESTPVAQAAYVKDRRKVFEMILKNLQAGGTNIHNEDQVIGQ